MTGRQTHTPRAQTFQEDLLQDLRLTTPVPDSPSSGSPVVVPETPAAEDRERTPTIEVRVTPTRWVLPSLRQAAGGRGMVLCAGPLSVSVALLP